MKANRRWLGTNALSHDPIAVLPSVSRVQSGKTKAPAPLRAGGFSCLNHGPGSSTTFGSSLHCSTRSNHHSNRPTGSNWPLRHIGCTKSKPCRSAVSLPRWRLKLSRSAREPGHKTTLAISISFQFLRILLGRNGIPQVAPRRGETPQQKMGCRRALNPEVGFLLTDRLDVKGSIDSELGEKSWGRGIAGREGWYENGRKCLSRG